MRKPSNSLILGLFLALIPSLPLTAASAPVNTAAAAANSAPAGQAPEEGTKKIADLVHAGKYAEAQQLTTGLLVAYPNDQRLSKAKTVIEKLLAPARSTTSTPTNRPVQPATGTNAEKLTGMDRVDYNALIEMVRQAQRNTDLEQQQASLRQFMDESKAFLQKYPGQMLLWQIRGASALSLQDPEAGYEAGQALLAAGAAGSDDPKLQQLLAQLKNKGWLDEKEATKQKQSKHSWIAGAWSIHYSGNNGPGQIFEGDDSLEFSGSDSVFEGYFIRANRVKQRDPDVRVTILDSGEIRCELVSGPALSCEIDDHNRTVKIVFPYEGDRKYRVTWLLHKQ